MRRLTGLSRKRMRLTILILILFGCGSGNDPLLLIGDPGVLPSMNLPSPLATFVSPFSSSQDCLGVSVPALYPVVAPAAGTIYRIESASAPINGYHIWIYHTANLMTRITVPSTVVPSVRVGDVAGDGTAITGAMAAPTAVYIAVIFNSSSICPVAFLKAAARTQINGSIPCI